MPKQVQFRRGTTAEHATFTGVIGEITVDTTKDTAVVHDGSLAGGYPLARESALANFAPFASPTFTGTVTTATADLLGSVRGSVTTVAASAVDCSLGNYFIKTATGALTWTATNVPATRAYSFILELTNGGTGAQTWYSGIKWPGGTAPTLVASGVDVLGFITDDGGTTWRGVHLMKDSK